MGYVDLSIYFELVEETMRILTMKTAYNPKSKHLKFKIIKDSLASLHDVVVKGDFLLRIKLRCSERAALTRSLRTSTRPIHQLSCR